MVAKPSRIVPWLAVLVWCAVIFWFSSIPSLGTGLGAWDLLLRKAAHMTEYAILVGTIALGAILTLVAIGSRIKSVWNKRSKKLSNGWLRRESRARRKSLFPRCRRIPLHCCRRAMSKTRRRFTTE